MKDWQFKERTEERVALRRLLQRPDINDQERAALTRLVNSVEFEIQHSGDDPANQGTSPDAR